MGSQTFEILRQGVWASLTGGWFYDPHQTVLCNVIHLYLWLFLLCGPFLTYLYFPTTPLTWTIYCIVTTLTVSILKILNMALHLLYDKAQTVSDPCFKIDVKSTKIPVSDECGIEMQVIGNDIPSRISIEQPINEVSEANSMLSLDHVTSTIDLKVDVHRKNSSESSDSISMYPPNIYQDVHQPNDSNQQTRRPFLESLQSSQNQLAENIESSIQNNERDIPRRYSDNLSKLQKSSAIPSQFSVPIFKDYTHNNMLVKPNPLRNRQHNRNFSQGQEFLSEIWKNTQLNSLPTTSPKATSCSLYQTKPVQELMFIKNGEGLVGNVESACENEVVERKGKTQNSELSKNLEESSIVAIAMKTNDLEEEAAIVKESEKSITNQRITDSFHMILLDNNEFEIKELSMEDSCDVDIKTLKKKSNKVSKVQRHHSSESHEENRRHKDRNNLFKSPSRQEHSNEPNLHNNSTSSTLQLTTIIKQDNLQTKQPIVSSHSPHHRLSDKHLRSSDMYLSNSSYTKSDFGIEQFEENISMGNGENNAIHGLLLLKQISQMRKDSNSTMSALQLPIAASVSNLDQQQSQNKRRHSNTGYKPENNNGGSSGAISSSASQSSNVRRIKSTALDVACPQPSVSNLSPHPNSTEAIAGQQLKSSNPPLLPPPSKCLVRNQHLTFCSKFGGYIESSNPKIDINMDRCGVEYISPDYGNGNSEGIVYPIAEHIEKTVEVRTLAKLVSKLSLDESNGKNQNNLKISKSEIEEKYEQDINLEIDTNNEINIQNIIYDECANDNNIDADINSEITHNDESGNNNSDHFENNASSNNYDDNFDSVNSIDMKRSSNTTESESEIERPRTQSTDSETDNNGSRSPLLNKNGRDICKVKVPDLQQPKSIQLGNEKFYKSTKKNKDNFSKQNFNKCIESGCPSSDYEHVSSSSKGILLESVDHSYNKIDSACNKTYKNEKHEKTKALNECTETSRGLNIAQEEADIENLRLKDAKSLGINSSSKSIFKIEFTLK